MVMTSVVVAVNPVGWMGAEGAARAMAEAVWGAERSMEEVAKAAMGEEQGESVGWQT